MQDMYQNFQGPIPREFEEEFGAEVESDPTEGVHVVRFKEVTGEDFSISYSTTQGSVRAQLRDGNQFAVVDIFREGVTRLRIQSGKGDSSIVIDYGDQEFTGVLQIQIFPRVQITDRMLFT
ncbi:hypothetical protein ACH4VT_25075 [Streptomyces lydicus]|uniref:hypothetical protein n=1 Tax=Streptomyces lydicus TaxID=47763 RepID=UPI0037A2F4E7